MADLASNFCGIKSPNPFWLASAPPTDKEYNVRRAFEAGWGGVVWKTLGVEGPPIVNVNGPRYGAIWGADRRLIGLNNIELITDRPLEVNLKEMRQIKKDFPDRALVASVMVPCEEMYWKDIIPQIAETGVDGFELNFGCPHGMSERGMGSAVGQVPEYIEMVTRWCKESTELPVIVKLTPNITNIIHPAAAAKNGGADAVSLINTISSIVSVDLDNMAPNPTIDGKGTAGGYCGPAVKPIALNMVAQIARTDATAGLPISGIGGVTTWRDAAEFLALGAGNVQVCTAAMTYGFDIINEMTSGLSSWLDENGYKTFLQAEWKLQARSDRTGFRLDGPPLTFTEKATNKSPEHGYEPSNIIDQGYPIGGINLAGQTPIILVNDGPSMGGFIVPFTVPSASFWKLGQARPSEKFKFIEISVEESQEMRSAQTELCTKWSIL